MKPDFLITPYEVKAHPDLRPSDGDVYAVIYWFEKMKDGKCTASNETIAGIARIEARSVQASLDRLERVGFIERVYLDNRMKVRAEIKTMISFRKTNRLFDINTNSVGIQVATPRRERPENEETPGQFAKRFFARDHDALKEITNEMLLKSHGRGADILEREIPKFIAYWTEPNKMGTKELWETMPTFEVRRRLATWFSRIKENQRARSGAGATV